MDSMYDTIMELPLFKGIGEEQLSQMLEKTSVDFRNFEKGAEIASRDENVKTVDFIISGEASQTYRLAGSAIKVEEILGKGALIGARRLFGIDTTYSGDVYAKSDLSLMRIDKMQYMDILQRDRIYMLNYVNYISAALQRCPSYLMTTHDDTITRDLKMLGLSMTSRLARKILLNGKKRDLAEYCGVSIREFVQWCGMINGSKGIKITDEGVEIGG